MKNTKKWNAILRMAGFIAIVAMIGFSMAGCDTDDDGGNGGGNHALIGTWIKGSDSISFGPDNPPASNQVAILSYNIGAGSGSGMNTSLTISGNAANSWNGGLLAFNFTLSNNNNTLAITGSVPENLGYVNFDGTWTRQQ